MIQCSVLVLKKCFVLYILGEINKPEFELILNMIGIDKDDKNLKERLYWVFDLNENGSIDSKEVAYCINLFREYSLEEKVKSKIIELLKLHSFL